MTHNESAGNGPIGLALAGRAGARLAATLSLPTSHASDELVMT